MKSAALSMLTRAQRDPERDDHPRPLSLRLYQRMFGYARKYPKILSWLVVAATARSIELPLLAVAFSKVINGPIKNENLSGLLVGVAGYALLAIFTIFTLFHRQRLALLIGEGVVHDLRRDIFGRLQGLTMRFFDKTRLGRIISRVTVDAESVRAGIQDAIFVGIVNTGQVTVAVAVMLWTNRPLFWIVAATTPIYYVTYRYFKGRLSRVNRDVQESYARLTATLAESVGGIRVTQGFVRQDLNAGMWRDLVLDHANFNLAVSRATGTFQPVLELVNTMLMATLFIIGGWMILRPDSLSTLDNLILFFFLVGNVLDPIAMLGNMYSVAVNSMAGAERVFHLLDRKPDFADPPDAVELKTLQGRVEFHNLAFSYDPGKPVLRGIDFTAEPGQTVALVGHTGSGKTSIINLIAKFHLPDSGELLIDGIDIRRISADSLHRHMGIVLQQNFLFTGTVMENIRLGKDYTEEQAIEAARRLDILDLFEALPDGFATRVGERGSGLSLGQRQLVCFARSMLADPRILILDEATSAVDALTEARIQQALGILLQNRTSFVVAHRLSTIRKADLILVLDHGRIVERGRHVDLLAEGGVYSHLYGQFIRSGRK